MSTVRARSPAFIQTTTRRPPLARSRGRLRIGLQGRDDRPRVGAGFRSAITKSKLVRHLQPQRRPERRRRHQPRRDRERGRHRSAGRGLGRRTAEPDAAERLPAGTDSIRIGPSKGLRANSAPRWNRFQNKEPDVSGSGLPNSRLFRNVVVGSRSPCRNESTSDHFQPVEKEKHQ